MSIFNIPQFIETEDKIAGPLTAKQLGWMVAAAATIVIIYLFFGKIAAVILAIPALLIYGGLAFYKPNGQPLTFIAGSVVNFIFHPKLYVWKKLPDEDFAKKEKVLEKPAEIPPRKPLTRTKISEISALLNAPREPGERPKNITYGNITFK